MATDFNQVSQDLAQDMEMLRNSVQRNSVSFDQLDRVGKSSSDSLQKFKDQVNLTGSTFVKSIYDGSSALQTMSATTATLSQSFQDVLKSIPVFGGALSVLTQKIFGATKVAIDTTDVLFKAYGEISKAGLTGAEGLSKFIEQAQKFGFSADNIDRFVSAMNTGAESFAQFSGGIQNGIDAIANVAQDIKESGLRGELIAMGMNIPEITTGLMRYTRILSMTGQQNRMDQTALRKGAESYIKQLDLLSKLTGKQTDQIQKEREARETDERIMIRRMESQQEEARLRALKTPEAIAEADRIAAARERERELIDLIPENMQREFGAMFADLITSPQMASMIQAMPETTRYIQSGGRDIVEFSKLISKELKVFTDPSGGVGASAARVGQLLQGFGLELKDVVKLQNLTAAIAEGNTVEEAKQQQRIRDQNTKNIARSEDLNAIAREEMQRLITEGIQPLISEFTDLNERIIGLVKVIPPYPFGGVEPRPQPPPPITGEDINRRRIEAGQTPLSPEAAEAQAAREAVQREMERRNRARQERQRTNVPGGAAAPVAPGANVPGTAATPPRDPLAGLNFGGLEAERTGGGAASPTLIAKARQVMQMFGPETVITALNDVFHRERYPNSAHVKGLAMDFALGPAQRPKDRQEAAAMKQALTDLGLINVRDEYFADVTNATTGPHFHAEVSARFGRLTSGPLSGYRATLHGNEVVIPLSNGTTIPLDMTPLIRNLDSNAQALSAQIQRLDDLIMLSRDTLNVNRKMLSYRG